MENSQLTNTTTTISAKTWIRNCRFVSATDETFGMKAALVLETDAEVVIEDCAFGKSLVAASVCDASQFSPNLCSKNNVFATTTQRGHVLYTPIEVKNKDDAWLECKNQTTPVVPPALEGKIRVKGVTDATIAAGTRLDASGLVLERLLAEGSEGDRFVGHYALRVERFGFQYGNSFANADALTINADGESKDNTVDAGGVVREKPFLCDADLLYASDLSKAAEALQHQSQRGCAREDRGCSGFGRAPPRSR